VTEMTYLLFHIKKISVYDQNKQPTIQQKYFVRTSIGSYTCKVYLEVTFSLVLVFLFTILHFFANVTSKCCKYMLQWPNTDFVLFLHL